MREVPLGRRGLPLATESFLACVATVLELPLAEVPVPAAGEDPAAGGTVTRWLGRLGLSLARVADPASFSWPGPWIARIAAAPPAPSAPDCSPAAAHVSSPAAAHVSSPAAAHVSSPAATPSRLDESRFVVMFGVPAGIVWDPARPPSGPGQPPAPAVEPREGFLIAPADVALALPPQPRAPSQTGTVVAIAIAAAAGEPVQALSEARALAGRGLEGDRHVLGTGTFPSRVPGSALTLIAAEVCESFDPPLEPNEHRRNLVTRGIDLNRLVGRTFTIGEVRCRGMRLCEPWTVVQRYAGRAVLRALVHRGGLRADILSDGWLRVGDPIRAEG